MQRMELSEDVSLDRGNVRLIVRPKDDTVVVEVVRDGAVETTLIVSAEQG